MTHTLSEYSLTRLPEAGQESLGGKGSGGWDLHCHTVFSDGTVDPQGLVDSALRLGLGGVAITDHDTAQGWPEAGQAARSADFPVLPGTEITTDDQGVSVHLLGYGYDPGDHALARLFTQTRQARLERARTMVDAIGRDYPIDWGSVLAQVKEGGRTTVGRPHIADALVAAGVYRTRSEAFEGVCSTRSPYYIPTPSPTTAQAVVAVKAAGGVTVVAHPAAVKRNKALLSDARIERLAELGLDGLEVWHRDNPPRQRVHLSGLAGRLGLLVTGGSDWHGAGKPNRLGEYTTPLATVETIIARSALA
ncbi:PHP domain-containing protein [Bifidobacterium xylocopae]|uniref:Phosphatase n=1 Tax=Bifidobacterium xylocopae TaxID=2493119 RepID=A0A366KCW3_9BIFI|nr:PHP domain-containing protein [Bifidobacterium xylocopae]RBP99062.1 phosphatase [Bifidobacterium xylocopae]